MCIAEDNLRDIKLFFGSGVPETVEKRDKIIDELAGRANGMFLYASFVLPQLQEMASKGTLRHDNLKVLPTGIAQIYQRDFDFFFDKVGEAKYQKLLGPIMCKWE